MIGNFVWGDGGKAITPDEAKRRREIAMAMIQQGTANRPIQHWAQGAANVAQALMGAYDMRQTDKQEAAAREESKASEAQFLGMLGGGGGGTTASPAMAPQGGGQAAPAPPPQGGVRASPDMLRMIEEQNAQAGLPPGYLTRTAQIESGMNPSAKNPNSSAAGLFQFIDSTRRQYGNFDPMDASASTAAAARLASDNKAALVRAFGREPTAGELYLAHQQGAGGASKLLANPNARAVDLLGANAVRLNGGDENMTAGQFASKWTGKFGDGASPAAPQAAPVTPVQQVAQANPQVLQAAMARMNDPYASPGSRAVAQALVQRIISQETKDPMAQEKLRLEVEDMRKRSGRVEMETMTAPDGTVFEREKGRPGAQWQQSIKLPSKPEEATSDQRELAQINKEREAAGQPKLRLDEWKIQKNRANAATVNIGQDGQQYGNPGDGLVWQRDQTGKVMIDERGAPIAIPYRGGKMFVDDQKRADVKAEQAKQKSAQADMIMQDIDRTLGLMDNATLPTTGSFGAVLKNVPGTAAADMARLTDGIKANIGFDKLAEMRAASPTGAALGSVTEKELTFLQSVVGSLEQSQSAAQYRFNLTRLKNAYLDTIHGVGKGPPRDPLPNAPGVKPSSTAPANLQPESGRVLRYNPQTGEFE